MKKSLYLLLICVLLIPMVTTSALSLNGVRIYIDGEVMEFPVPARIINAATYVPVRTIFEYLNGEVCWNAATKTAIIDIDGIEVSITEGMNYVIANGRYLFINDGVKNIDGALMIHVRTVAKIIGAKVEWNEESRSVRLCKTGKTIKSGEEYYNKDEVYWLSKIISSESAGEPLKGQIAVGNVVLNRMTSKEFPDSIYDVIFDTIYGVQFEPVLNGTIYDNATESSVIAAKLCLDGADVAEDSLYFFNPSLAQSFWIERNRSFRMTIENHKFFA